jgi:putative hemolysin
MELLIILVLVLLNGVLAMSELAVVSSRSARLQNMIEEGSESAQVVLDLTRNPNRFLSTVQIGITLIGILAGAFGGATLANDLADRLREIPALAQSADAIGVAAIVVLTTYLSLVIGELVPKRLALLNPERIATVVARPMRLLSLIASPLVRLLSFSTDLLLRLMGVKTTLEVTVTEAEIISMIQQGTTVGIFERTEQVMIEGIFRLDNLPIGSVMTPRRDIVWLDVNDEPLAVRQKILEVDHSFYPVINKEIDDVVGVVSAKDILVRSLKGDMIDILSLMRVPVFLPENASAAHALETLRTSGSQLALVVGEYGGIEGVVTITDIVEEIVGALHAGTSTEAFQREDGSWLLDGLLPFHRLQEIFSSLDRPEEEEGSYQTLAGFIMYRLGRVPQTGDQFTWNNLRFEVVDMDNRQIDKVMVQQLPDPESQDEEESSR